MVNDATVNDVKACLYGRLYVETIPERSSGDLYVVSKNNGGETSMWDCKQVASGFSYSNCISFKMDGSKLAIADITKHTIFLFNIDSTTGELSQKKKN